ncbi:hypothetical protein QN277_009046 [Acacia crassicarpa]|uniref:F-box domain-containing protein n=1 Tax=Acacia crassicarpa TaxID=499986 RepID=A0AAE1IU47_9FABA|nr:hypothetical protein QN277_009046 [Acacia crassicarpa]
MKKEMVIDSNEPYIPSEIITNILKRLPVKSLIRFQCVCKDWKNLFKTRSFISEHYRHSTHQNPYLIFQCNGCKCNPRHLCLMNRYMHILEYPTLPLTDSSMDLSRIVGSSNGLICLEFVRSKSYMLWNPAIREAFQVPEFKVLNFPHFGIVSYVGFGFSPIVNDCKIVRLFFSWLPDARVYPVVLVVFSLSTRSWKEVKVGKLEGIKPFTDGNSFAFDGAILWFGFRHVEKNEICILSFDIATEAFTLIPFPRSAVSDENNRLTTYDNKLALLSNNLIENTIDLWVFDLWVMEKCIEASGERWNWTKIYTSNAYPYCACLLSPPSIWKNEIFWESDAFRSYFGEANVTVPNDEEDEGKLVLCHLHTNEFKMLATTEPLLMSEVWNYAESLVSVCNIHIEASSS